METEIKNITEDIGEEIILKLQEINLRLNKILEKKNEKELQNQSMVRNRT